MQTSTAGVALSQPMPAKEKHVQRLVHVSVDLARQLGTILENVQSGLAVEERTKYTCSSDALKSGIEVSLEVRQNMANLAKSGVRKRRVCRMQVEDLLRFETPRADETLVYILTLGVVDSYRNHGIATSLIREVIKYASNIRTCQAVYLHVISYNNSAIHLYKKMSFQCVRRLHAFYYINGQHYDSYLFIFYVNGGRSPCSPLELATLLVAYVRSGFRSAASRLWWNKENEVPRWMKCKQSSSCLIPMTQNKRILTTNATGCQFA